MKCIGGGVGDSSRVTRNTLQDGRFSPGYVTRERCWFSYRRGRFADACNRLTWEGGGERYQGKLGNSANFRRCFIFSYLSRSVNIHCDGRVRYAERGLPISLHC